MQRQGSCIIFICLVSVFSCKGLYSCIIVTMVCKTDFFPWTGLLSEKAIIFYGLIQLGLLHKKINHFLQNQSQVHLEE